MDAIVDNLGRPYFQRALLEAVLVGVLAGVVGVHVVLRRLQFFVVAMSHATFPGVVLASIAGISLFVGGTAFGLVVVALIVSLGALRAIDNTSVIGVVLGGAFAVGVLVLSARPSASKELSAFLVGSILTVDRADLLTTLLVGAAVAVVLVVFHKELVFAAFDRGGAAAAGYRVAALDTLILVVVTIAIVVAVPAVGTLLALAMLTVPALTARLWADRVGPTMLVAALLGAASGVVGLLLSAAWSIAAGGAIALTAAAFFALSVAVRAVPLPTFVR
jgi:manganese/iron transport system permease protein